MLINYELMNIISYCDGMFICVCVVYNPLVSCEANVLSWADALRFRLGLMDRIAGQVSVGY